MKKINIRKKVLGALVMCIVCMITIMPTTAFAQSDENAKQQEVEATIVPTVKPTVQPTIKPTVKPTVEPEEVAEATYGPLTPDGNMSLVDDYGSLEMGGEQFITVVTKSGNYFYLIIDRDDQGEETVHFLNMVDELDLLKLMDEEEAKEYTESTAGEEVPIPTATISGQTEGKSEAGETEKSESSTQKNSSTGILVVVLLVTVVGIGGYIFLKGSKKKNQKKAGRDPDVDYIDEEEDFLADLEEDGTEEMEQEEEL